MSILGETTHPMPPKNWIPNMDRFIQYNLTDLLYILLLLLALAMIYKLFFKPLVLDRWA